jgi:hypothetical protein
MRGVTAVTFGPLQISLAFLVVAFLQGTHSYQVGEFRQPIQFHVRDKRRMSFIGFQLAGELVEQQFVVRPDRWWISVAL